MRSLAQNTMLQKVRIEVRASDLHIFIVSDPVWAEGNDHFSAFQDINKYVMGEKLVTLQCKKTKPLDGSPPQDNPLYPYYPGISCISRDGRPIVPKSDLVMMARKLYDRYSPLVYGPFGPPPAKVRMQAAQRIEMAIVHSAVREDKYSDFDIFAEALSQLVRKAEQPSGSSSASTVGGLEEKIGQVRAFCSSEVALLRREVRQLQSDMCGLQAMMFPASAPGTPATTTTTELTASQPAGATSQGSDGQVDGCGEGGTGTGGDAAPQ